MRKCSFKVSGADSGRRLELGTFKEAMLRGPAVTAFIAAFAFGAVIWAFSKNASPYVTIAQAKTISGDHLHLAGDILKDTVHMDMLHRTLTFDLKDATGATVEVVHEGDPPANMDEAKKVVAVGGMENGKFISHQLLIKCPSKYEAAPGQKVAKN